MTCSGTYYAVERGSYTGQYQSEGLLFDVKATRRFRKEGGKMEEFDKSC